MVRKMLSVRMMRHPTRWNEYQNDICQSIPQDGMNDICQKNMSKHPKRNDFNTSQKMECQNGKCQADP